MPLIWERVPTAVESEWEGGHPHPCNALYRLKVPGGWLLRDEVLHYDDGKSITLPASGPTLFIPDPDHAWEVPNEPHRTHEPIAALLNA